MRAAIVGSGTMGRRIALACFLGGFEGSLFDGVAGTAEQAVEVVRHLRATTHYNEPQVVAECSEELGEAMRGIDVSKLDAKELLQTRGW